MWWYGRGNSGASHHYSAFSFWWIYIKPNSERRKDGFLGLGDLGDPSMY